MSKLIEFLNRLQREELPEVSVIRDDKTRRLLLRNNKTGEKILLVDNGKLAHFTLEDINFERVNRLENMQNASRLSAPYGFYVDPFRNGVALVSWTLYPDGRYFEDEDGFGGENCNETSVYSFIDGRGKVLIPFQDMDSTEKEQLRSKAENLVSVQKL